MKKILTLTFVFFLISKANAQSFDDYYFNKYKSNNKKSYKKLKIVNTDSQSLEIVKQKNPPKKSILPSQNTIIFSKDSPKNKIITTTTTEHEEAIIIRKKIKSRTVGNYLGIDFINTDLRYRSMGYYNEEEKLGPVSGYTTPKYKNSFGLKYFYALNYRGFYIAPEVFFEYNNIKKHFDGDNLFEREIVNQRNPLRFGYKFLKIHRTYGGKINFGYDITPNFAPFVFTGISKIHYSALDSIYPKRVYPDENNANDFTVVQDFMEKNGQINPFAVVHKSKLAPFFGFGTKIKITDRFLLNAEYLIYDLRLKSNSQGQKNPNVDTYQMGTQDSSDFNDFEASLRIAKVGLLYNF
jgi:hypothetical protein